MTAQAALYGRMGQDPKSIDTRSGKEMATASIAVNINARDEETTEWFGIVAFGRVAKNLLHHAKGDPISVSGRLQLNTWTSNGEERRQWQIVADAVISARSVRPGGRAPKTTGQPDTDKSFDDPVPFG